MRKYIIYIKTVAVLLTLIMFMPACSDYLTVTPNNKLIKEKFWIKKEDADAALASTYESFRSSSQMCYFWGEIRADLLEIKGDDDIARISRSNITVTNGMVNWSNYYKTINLANTLMHFGDVVVEKDKSFTPRMKQAYDAECLFLRSLSYFYLVRVWKEVPLITEAIISDQDSIKNPKSTEKQVLNQIITDLTYAKDIAYTDELIDDPRYYKGRANKYAIMALLADVYLWDEQYEKCISYCDSLTNTGKFALESLNDWFGLYYPGNSLKESIFEIQFDDNLEGQQNPLYSFLSKAKLKELGEELVFVDRSDHRLIGTKGPKHKYAGIDYNASTKRNSKSERDPNMIFYRYADILLMKAEALCELNNIAEANAFLRLTKERANLIHTDISNKADLQQEILNEKGREFVIEGKRWFDMLRFAKRNNFENKQALIQMILNGAEDILELQVLKGKVYDTMGYYLPVPKSELLYNPEMVQNPFYDK